MEYTEPVSVQGLITLVLLITITCCYDVTSYSNLSWERSRRYPIIPALYSRIFVSFHGGEMHCLEFPIRVRANKTFTRVVQGVVVTHDWQYLSPRRHWASWGRLPSCKTRTCLLREWPQPFLLLTFQFVCLLHNTYNDCNCVWTKTIHLE